MNVQYLQTLTCSAVKFNELLRYYGKADIIPISFLSLLYKLLDNPNMTIPFGCDRHLQQLAAKIQMENPNICTPSAFVSNEIISNTAPTVDDGVVSYDADFYAFQYEDFTNNFDDVDGDSPQTVRVLTLPVNGDLTWNGQPVAINFEFDISEVHDLEFTRTNEEIADLFTFRISDDNTNKLFSNMASMTINIDQVINQPPDNVGVNAFTVLQAGVKLFTLADFTTGTTPAYSDPDGDPAEAVKVTSLPIKGILTVSGIPVDVNQTIPVASISSGLFAYTADPLDLVGYVEPFTFSMSDTGSHEFTAGGTITMTAEAYVNQPATIGDGELTVTEGVVITFTRADFTSNTTPPYSDPEGDIADKLKIIVLPTAGDLKLDGVTVLLNDVINFSDIDLSKLTYVQAASAGGTSPDFDYAIADAGSGTFVT